MPTYEYECSKCGIVFEHYQSIKDEPLKTCIHPDGCKHPESRAKVTRLLGTGAGIIFKGSGFYSTDYRSKEYREAAKRESGNGTSSNTPSTPSNGNGAASSPGTSSTSSAPASKQD